jgi:peptidoglycan/xylan/chitin deacetylase (PgdA/CDA1 family)
MIDGVERLRKLTMAAMYHSGIAALARPFFAGRGVILMLHRVTDAAPKPLDLNGHLAVRPAFLDAVLGDMKRLGYRFVDMDEAVRLTADPDGGAPFAAITLDDGFRDNLLEALPVFEKHASPFTVFIAPGLIDGAVSLWWEVIEDVVAASDRVLWGSTTIATDTREAKVEAFRFLLRQLTQERGEAEQQALVTALASGTDRNLLSRSRSLLMDWQEIRSLAAHPLATIGAHTVNHYALKRLPEAQALEEMEASRTRLQAELGSCPRHLAYPYGYPSAAGEREARLAKQAGFVSAVTTRHGLLHREHASHLHALPRLSLNGRYQSLAHVRTMLAGLTVPLANRGRRFVTM